ncbi:MAG: putative DNA binding domain-containing protein [Candidatus Methanomethylophilaceae archaeon]|nr:putative DNA binding domain-containing protein [Candidatus Methanomethylophilaceae archaeon]
MDIENIDTEWKESWALKYLKTIAAFHNTAGGRMIIGRNDNGVYVGIQNIKKETKTVADDIRNKLHIMSNTRAEAIEGKNCIVIDVPKGDKLIDYEGKFYMRVGNTTQQIEGDDLKKILLDERGMQWLDQASKVTVDALSSDALSLFLSKGKSAGRIPADIEADFNTVLNRFQLINDGKLTDTAVLLFHPNPYSVNYGAYAKIGLFDDDGLLIRDDIIRCPLIQLADETMRILLDKYIQPTYGYGGGTTSRHLVFQYPEKALRELLVNAIVHMDYSIQSPILVRVFKDHLEISNPGSLLSGLTAETLKVSHRSVLRNEKLADVFYASGMVENWGQGITKVLVECKNNANPEPEFTEVDGEFKVVIKTRAAVIPDTEALDHFKVDEKSKAILACMIDDPSVSIRMISEITHIPLATIKRRVKSMTDSGHLMREGNAKAGKWIVVKK